MLHKQLTSPSAFNALSVLILTKHRGTLPCSTKNKLTSLHFVSTSELHVLAFHPTTMSCDSFSELPKRNLQEKLINIGKHWKITVIPLRTV